ncbi:hypothetical protein FQN50_005536 [Emmonsiellopsis sp. PD_5]|nr:hypothetical protein FQN50_005536 [Emmonsiellopsis sp. PD_5]
MKLQSLLIALAAIGVNGLPQNKRSVTLPDLTFSSISLPTGALVDPILPPPGKRYDPLLPVTQTFPTKPMPTTPPNYKRAQGPNADAGLLEQVGNLIEAFCPNKWVVKPGDTCQSIAQTAGITVAQLIKLNPLYLTDCNVIQNLKVLCLRPYNLPIPLPPPSKNNKNNDPLARRAVEGGRPPLSAVSPPASSSSSSSSTPLTSLKPWPTATGTGAIGRPTGGAGNAGLNGRAMWRNSTVAAEPTKSGMAKRTGTGFF